MKRGALAGVDSMMSRSFNEDFELMELSGIKVVREKRPRLDALEEASPKRVRLSLSGAATAPNSKGPSHKEVRTREPQEGAASLRQGLKDIVHTTVSKAVFSLDCNTELSHLMDAFQSMVEKNIDSGAIHVQSSQCGQQRKKARNIHELKQCVKKPLGLLTKFSGGGLVELNVKLMALKREAAAWEQMIESSDDLVAVMADSKAEGVELGLERNLGKLNDEADGLQVFERLMEIGQAVQLEERKLAAVQHWTNAARDQAVGTTKKLLEMRNEKEFFRLLPNDMEPIDMVKTLLGP